MKSTAFTFALLPMSLAAAEPKLEVVQEWFGGGVSVPYCKTYTASIGLLKSAYYHHSLVGKNIDDTFDTLYQEIIDGLHHNCGMDIVNYSPRPDRPIIDIEDMGFGNWKEDNYRIYMVQAWVNTIGTDIVRDLPDGIYLLTADAVRVVE